MEQTTEEIVATVRQWSIDRIHELSDTESPESDQMYHYRNALSIAEEFDEWLIDYEDSNQELDIMYMEKNKEIPDEEYPY